MESNVTTIKLETISNINKQIKNFEEKSMFTDDAIELNEMIDIDPKFQRDIVWKDLYKSQLITSLIHGWAIPNIILSSTEEGFYQVFDGKQRLTAIRNFLTNKFQTDDTLLTEEYNKKFFKDLPKELQTKILRTELAVMRISMSEKEKSLLYSRINDNTTKLSSGEIRKGKFFNHKTYQVMSNFANSFNFRSFFSEKNVLRLMHEDFLSRILVLSIKRPSSTSSLKTLTEDLLLDSSNLKEIETYLEKLEQILPYFNFDKWNQVKIWTTLGTLLTYDISIIKTYKKEISQFLKEFEVYDFKKERPDLHKSQGGGLYQTAMLIHIKQSIDQILSVKKDPRNFKKDLKGFLLSKHPNCEICKDPIDESNIELDHVIPYSKGGTTTVQNLAALCMPCNRKKGNLTLEDLK